MPSPSSLSTSSPPAPLPAGSDRPGGLAVEAAGVSFRNPIVLASGTAGYGHELAEVVDLDAIGGLTTKAVSVAPRAGAPPLRVGEFAGGMINAVGLANPGMEAVRERHLGWMTAQHPGTRVLVNVIGFRIEEFAQVVAHLDGLPGHAGYELNVSCPNTKAGGLEFGADPAALEAVVSSVRAVTARPVFVKLSPALGSALVPAAQRSVDAGADGLTLVNTMPGLVIDVPRRRPRLGFGSGGISGPALLPVGVLATWRVSRALPGVPICGLGGVSTASDALQYVLAGATLVGVGTAALRDPRAPERIVRGLARWCAGESVGDLASVRGTLSWPA
jgi:dihydroorotate dehydrogenase (NAD+) catalytic subunit